MSASTMTANLEELPINGFQKFLTIRSAGGWFVDGYVLSVVGVALVQASAALSLDNFWQGLIAAGALIGIFVGGLLGGWLSDKLGRRLMFFAGPTLFVIFSLAQFWADSGLTLALCRFFIGIGVGFEYPVASALLVEFLPKKSRGPRLAVLGILWAAGASVAYIVGNGILSAGGDDAWRVVFASSAVLGLVLFLIRLGTPESPRWLVGKGRREEADQVIRQVYGQAYSTANLPEEPDVQKSSLLQLLRLGYGGRLIFCVMFWTCSVIPLFAVYAFAPKVLAALNLQGDLADWGEIAITLLFVVGTIVGMLLVNSWGRRPVIIHSFLWSGLALLALGALANSSPTVILVLFGAYAVFIGGAQVLQLLYPNELFPTEVRSVAVGIGTAGSRIGAAIGTYLVPVSLEQWGISGTMYAAAAVTLVGLGFSWFLAPETKSLSLAEASALPVRTA